MGTEWVKAEELSPCWEGYQAWRWCEHDDYDPHIVVIPTNYSREPHHCRGLWFKVLTPPKPPKVKE